MVNLNTTFSFSSFGIGRLTDDMCTVLTATTTVPTKTLSSMIRARWLSLIMRILFSIFICTLISIPVAGQGVSTLFDSRIYLHAGDSLPYRILFPKNYDRTKKYPLILFLHGAGERGKDNLKQLTHGSLLFLADTIREKYPAIVIFPQCRENGYWGSVNVNRTTTPLTLTFDYDNAITPALEAATALVKETMRTQAVDHSRVYVIGLSMGGMGTFEIVHRNPKLFAAALPICGGGDTLRYTRRARQTPFWIFHGDQDNVVPVSLSRSMVDKLRSLRYRVQYSEYTGVNHNSWDKAFAEPDLLRWMFSNKR